MIHRLAVVAVCMLVSTLLSSQAWQVTDPRDIVSTGSRDIVPGSYVTFRVDAQALQSLLFSAPQENLDQPFTSEVFIAVGLANGQTDTFVSNDGTCAFCSVSGDPDIYWHIHF
jgi:hypothetical protein